MIVRYESWGAWVRTEAPPALCALDRDGVRALGLDGGTTWKKPPRALPIEVHLAITRRCGMRCRGCYLDTTSDGDDLPHRSLVERLDAIAEANVFTVAFGGGEPTLRDDLAALAEEARARGLVPVLTTSGIGLDPGKIEALRAFAQVNVSYDGRAAVYQQVRGYDGAHLAERAVSELAEAGVHVGVNVVLTRDSWPHLEETLGRARSLGAMEAQLLRVKPAHGAPRDDYLARRLTPAQAESFAATLRALVVENDAGDFALRVDCALVPFFSADPSILADPEGLARSGVLGCEAARHLVAVRSDGFVAPCSFATPSALDGRELTSGYDSDALLRRWRERGDAPPGPCASCPIAGVCRGGCRVVAALFDDPDGPDPECPRVLAEGGR